MRAEEEDQNTQERERLKENKRGKVEGHQDVEFSLKKAFRTASQSLEKLPSWLTSNKYHHFMALSYSVYSDTSHDMKVSS